MKTINPSLSKSELREYAIKVLSYKGFNVWRQNNIAVRGRTFIGRKGVSDILGYERATGKFLAAEVKTKGDKLSEDQILFLDDLKRSGAYTYLVVERDGRAEIENY